MSSDVMPHCTHNTKVNGMCTGACLGSWICEPSLKEIWASSSNFGFIIIKSIKYHEKHKNIHQNRLKIGEITAQIKVRLVTYYRANGSVSFTYSSFGRCEK